MALDSFRLWALNKTPLRQPTVLEAAVVGVLDDFGPLALAGQVELPVLDAAPISDDLALKKSADVTDDLSLQGGTPLTTQVTVVMPLPEQAYAARLAIQISSPPDTLVFALDQLPSTVDMFSALASTNTAGKVYQTAPKESSHRMANRLEQQVLFTTDQYEICRHGLKKATCATCHDLATRTSHRPGAMPKARTVDVFDLLLPYLQPPIDVQLAEPFLFPANLRPYPYQIQGIKFLAERTSALLGDEMGLGKTIQAIVALRLLCQKDKVRRVLILCPKSLLGVWKSELTKWAPELSVLTIRGTLDQRALLWQAKAAVYVTTYETLREDTGREISLKHRFDLAILDEAQKIKNPQSGVARAVGGVQTKYRWALTGTPLENRVEDVIALFDYLVPSLFAGWQNATVAWGPDHVKRKIQPYMLRRRLAVVMPELPEKIIDIKWLDLTEEQRRTYDRAEAEGRAQLQQPGVTRVHVFSLINELKQICNIDPASGTSCKLDYLVEQLDTIVESQEKALVFSQFPVASLRKIEPSLKQFSPAIFDGSLSDVRREGLINNFQERDSPKILLMSVKAGGVGLTLTAARHVFHFDHWWNPAVARQAEGRAHRLGQTQPVIVHDIYAKDTIEERIHDLLQEKQALFDTVVEDLSVDFVNKALSDEDLFALFDLKPPTPNRPSTRTNPVIATQANTDVLDRRGEIQPAASAMPSYAETSKLDDLNPVQFEHLIADLYTRLGYLADTTPQSRDGGIDVLARRPTPTGVDHLIIQCKHYPTGIVGEPAVRELVGAWQEHREATHAILVTSGRFSQDAIQLANRQRIRLVDRPQLMNQLRKVGIYLA